MLRQIANRVGASWRVWGAYGVLALVVMGPLLRSGFVLTLDMVFTPRIPSADGMSNTYFFYQLLHVLNLILPAELIEKLLLFIILMACGIGAHLMIRTRSAWPRYFAGVFYTINPFTYERLMAGQYLVLAGYAVLPFLLHALVQFVLAPGGRRAGKLGLWFTLLAVLSVHLLVLATLLAVVVIAVHLFWPIGQPRYRRRLLEYSWLMVGSALLLNCYWLAGVFSGSSPLRHTLDGIGQGDYSAFTTSGDSRVGVFGNVLGMFGFWLERFHRYYMPNHNLGLWVALGIGFAVLIWFGARFIWQRDKRLAYGLGAVAIISAVMAAGVDAPLTGRLVRAILNHVPLMRGFREPQKFSALLVLVYVYLSAYGLAVVLSRLRSWTPAFVPPATILALALPLAYTATMLFGCLGQLKPVQYPASWYTFTAARRDAPVQGKILFLPWHEYQSYDFSPRIIANPAANFFYPSRVLAGTDAEIGAVSDSDQSDSSRFIDQQILAHTNRSDLGQRLATQGIQYVLLADGYDSAKYSWLNHQVDLTPISSRPGLNVYLNQAYKQ